MVLPLGLMYLASYAREVFEGQVEFAIYQSLVDLDDNDPEAIEACIKREKPDIGASEG